MRVRKGRSSSSVGIIRHLVVLVLLLIVIVRSARVRSRAVFHVLVIVVPSIGRNFAVVADILVRIVIYDCCWRLRIFR